MSQVPQCTCLPQSTNPFCPVHRQEDDIVYDVTTVPERKFEIDVSKLPAPELSDTRTDETESEFLQRLFTPVQIEELRDTIRFVVNCTEGEFGNGHELTDSDLAEVVTWFQDQGWTNFDGALQ